MKNDFREFYDEDYIMHSMSEEEPESDHIEHADWASNLRKYVDKIRTRSGKWKYIYPEDLQKKAANLKRDVSYGVRNAVSKITGKNNTFAKKTNGPKSGDGHFEVTDGWAGRGTYYINTKNQIRNAYANEQKKGNAGTAAYNKRRSSEIAKERLAERARKRRQTAAQNANKQYYDKTGIADRKARQLAAQKANKQYYDKSESIRKARQTSAQKANTKYYDKSSSAYKTEHNGALSRHKYLSNGAYKNQAAAQKANKQYYDQTGVAERKARQAAAQKANAKYYDKTNDLKARRKKALENMERQRKAYDANHEYYDKTKKYKKWNHGTLKRVK